MSFVERPRETLDAGALIHYIFRYVFEKRAALYQGIPKAEYVKRLEEYRAAVEALTIVLPDALLPRDLGLDGDVASIDRAVKSIANLLYEKGIYMRMKRVMVGGEPSYESEW